MKRIIIPVCLSLLLSSCAYMAENDSTKATSTFSENSIPKSPSEKETEEEYPQGGQPCATRDYKGDSVVGVSVRHVDDDGQYFVCEVGSESSEPTTKEPVEGEICEGKNPIGGASVIGVWGKSPSDGKFRCLIDLSGEEQTKRNERYASHSALAALAGEIGNKVLENWNYAGDATGLETIISIKVARDGKVTSAQVVRSSGNDIFDRSAENAVRLASPLPFPDNPKYYEFIKEFNFLFSPEN